LRYITDFQAAVIAQRVGMSLHDLQIAAADAATIWRYVQANEWIDDPTMRTWASSHGLSSDRVNNGVRILTATNRLFAFEDTPISPPTQQDNAPPEIKQIAVNGTTLTLVYGESLDPLNVPAKGDYSITADGTAASVESVAVAGSVVSITLGAPAAPGQVFVLTYTPGAHPIQDYSGNAAPALLDAPVENHTPLESLPESELRKLAKKLGVDGPSALNKGELAGAIREAQAEERRVESAAPGTQ
jgi:uncharacterized repeat protein (TIGR02059 family)